MLYPVDTQQRHNHSEGQDTHPPPAPAPFGRRRWSMFTTVARTEAVLPSLPLLKHGTVSRVPVHCPDSISKARTRTHARSIRSCSWTSLRTARSGVGTAWKDRRTDRESDNRRGRKRRSSGEKTGCVPWVDWRRESGGVEEKKEKTQLGSRIVFPRSVSVSFARHNTTTSAVARSAPSSVI